MKSVWAAKEVVLLLASTATLCLPARALATLSARHVVPLVARHRAAPEPVVEFQPAHGHPTKSEVIRESAVNPPLAQESAMQHKATPDRGAPHKIVSERQPKPKFVPKLELTHKLIPESFPRHRVVHEPTTSNKIGLESEKKLTVVSAPEEEVRVPKLLSKGKRAQESSADRRIPGELRPKRVEARPRRRPGHGHGRPGNQAEATTTTTTTMDDFAAFCHEACKAGVGGPECNCP